MYVRFGRRCLFIRLCRTISIHPVLTEYTCNVCIAMIKLRMHSLHYPQVSIAIVDLVTFLKFNLLSIARLVSGR